MGGCGAIFVFTLKNVSYTLKNKFICNYSKKHISFYFHLRAWNLSGECAEDLLANGDSTDALVVARYLSGEFNDDLVVARGVTGLVVEQYLPGDFAADRGLTGLGDCIADLLIRPGDCAAGRMAPYLLGDCALFGVSYLAPLAVRLGVPNLRSAAFSATLASMAFLSKG